MEKNRIMEAFLSLGLLVLAVLCVAVPFLSFSQGTEPTHGSLVIRPQRK